MVCGDVIMNNWCFVYFKLAIYMDKYTFNKTLCMVAYEKKILENCSLHVELS